ncbi:glycosyltransferase family 31 protein [Pochonia chlamydosporia 170]|uniref:Glycosyltransferase family 31 protein n=1 Tax=Pochonia chlamydosporia 170 TaxID=1380566 RepID=A0A179FVB7_METCM|nr:glycosyltransferase family 31 protein [Pochonia chlamydosporia 170]OAQ69061.1 glycosyltransferase family 31 protein [Pochonia chlamydosporia 170]
MLLSKGVPVLQVRLSHLLLTAAIAGLLFQATKPYRQGRTFTFDVEDTTPAGNHLPEEEYLERLIDHYGLANFTKWQAWRVQSSEQTLDLSPITDIHANFQPHWDTPKTIDLSNPTSADLRAAKRMELPIHNNKAQDKMYGATFLFGISTSYQRIIDKDWAVLRAWKRWLTKSDGTSNGAGLVLMLDNATEKQLNDIDKALHDAGIDAYATATAEPTSKTRRYYELIRVMKTYGATLAASGQEKRWFGVVEDTIFFPNLHYLQERLSTYDTSEQLYIGIPSEKQDWQQEGKSVTTNGGGAIFLTRQAVSLIPKLPCMETDASAGPPFRAQKWDVVLKHCVKRWAGMDMHVIPAFYSPHDSNYKPHLESHETGSRPLLLHDYQDRHRLDVGMAHLVTDVCGEACFMHQYLFHDNWVVINGVSISHHPDGLNRYHRHEGEDEGNAFGNAEHTPVSGQIVMNEDKVERRPLNWTGRRDVWKLIDSAKAANGSIWQAYLKKGTKPANKGNEGDESEELDSVIVLIWEKRKH